jgi:hypothetical protein
MIEKENGLEERKIIKIKNPNFGIIQKPKKYPAMTAGELITPKFYPQPKKKSDL